VTFNVVNTALVAVTHGTAAAPIAVARNTSTALNVIGNDTEGENNLDPGTVSLTVMPAHGSVGASAAGVVTYRPTTGYVGPDTVSGSIAG
jgi:hypothetical protein